jgi:hypothetical protein
MLSNRSVEDRLVFLDRELVTVAAEGDLETHISGIQLALTRRKLVKVGDCV